MIQMLIDVGVIATVVIGSALGLVWVCLRAADAL